MPYITEDSRQDLLENDRSPETPGELNYLITVLCKDYADTNGYSYTTFNEIVGVLECAKQEFYRKLIVNYENQKCIENGEVYT